MFGLFKTTPSKPELTDSQLNYFNNQFHWLLENFGETLIAKEALVPDRSCFPFVFDGTEKPVYETLEVICRQMDIAASEIHLDFFDEAPERINAGASDFWLLGDKSSRYASGLYWGKAEDGKYHIWIKKDLLKNPEGLVATLAHELAHKRLLGNHKLHNKYDRDHEYITEMFCVFCGFGVFKAEQAFRLKKGFEGWSYRKSGYLRQQSWGYLLGLYAFLRDEEDPAWMKFLSPDLKKDFKNSFDWLSKTNAGEIFLAGKWKNNSPLHKESTMNLTGKWQKKSIYGSSYKELAGESLFSDLELNDDEGTLSGTGKDTSGEGMQQAPITIEGTVRNEAVQFSLRYNFQAKTDENGIVLRAAEREPYAVEYNGAYSPFLDAITGEWIIHLNDPERGKLIGGVGTFEMKRG